MASRFGQISSTAGQLPDGVLLTELETHADDRGTFTELFRREWQAGVDPIQWNVVRSRAGVLRGFHVHALHDDYLTVIEGHATVGLSDLRSDSPTAGHTCTVDLIGDEMLAITIPTGVGHGFLFHRDSTHVYSVSRYWDLADELACRWDDPELGIDWPFEPSAISERDLAAASMAEMVAAYERLCVERDG